MELIELTDQDKQAYNDFVASQEGGSFLQSWEWGEWQKILGNTPLRFAFADDGGTWQAAMQCIEMPLLLGKCFLYMPYGPVVSGEFRVASFESLLKALQKKNSESLFTRIEPQKKIENLDAIAIKTINIQPAITMVVDLRQAEEQLLASMHPKTRYNIKLAEKHGVDVQQELVIVPGHGMYIQEAVKLILDTQKRQKYRGHSESYYQKLIDFFAVHNADGDVKLRIYRALYKKQLLVSAIMMDFGKTRMYLYGGSSDECREVMAPYALHWRAMRDAKMFGIENYDLGGSEVASGGEKGFTRFKRGFGGSVVEFSGAYDVPANKTWYTVYKGMRRVNRILKHI